MIKSLLKINFTFYILLLLWSGLFVADVCLIYKIHQHSVQDSVLEKNLVMLGRNVYKVNADDLAEFLRYHPNYPCHVHSKQGTHIEFYCYEPLE